MRLVTYVGPELAALCVQDHQTLRQTMFVMSKIGLRLVPVVAADGVFAGVVADGDLRRHVANGGALDDPIARAVNRAPFLLDHDLPAAELRHLMQWRGVESLPQVKNGVLQALHVLWVGNAAQDLTAVIMAGGLGSRLAPLTDTCPKPLLAIAGKPILTHIIEHLRTQGVTRFILSVNHLSEMIVNHYGDGSDLGISIDYIHETMRMGTGGALGLADEAVLSEPFLCLNGDILNDIDVAGLQATHRTNNWDATMVLCEHSYTVPYGVVRTTASHAFDYAEEKPTLHFNINAGIYMLSKAALKVVPRGVFYDLPTLFSDMKLHGMQGGSFRHTGRWIDIGNVVEFERARKIYEGQ